MVKFVLGQGKQRALIAELHWLRFAERVVLLKLVIRQPIVDLHHRLKLDARLATAVGEHLPAYPGEGHELLVWGGLITHDEITATHERVVALETPVPILHPLFLEEPIPSPFFGIGYDPPDPTHNLRRG